MNKLIYYSSFFLAVFIFCQVELFSEDVLRPRDNSPSKGSGEYSLTGFDSRSPISFGLECGANLNLYRGDINVNQRYIDNINRWLSNNGYDIFYYFNDLFYVFESGFGVSPHLGFFVDIPINEKAGIGARVNYDVRTFGAKKDASGDITLYYGFNSISLEYKDKFFICDSI